MKKLSQTQWIAVVVALGAVGYIFFLGGSLNNVTSNLSQSGAATMSENNSANQTTLVVQDSTVGTGAEAMAGKVVTVNYVGTFQDGTKFDASADHGEPFSFTLGAGEVIKGWDQGVAGMKIGGKRVLIVPPELGYGDRQVGPIPPNSTLIFAVELLKVEDQKPGLQ